MIADPIVEEIHKYRDEYARQFNYDLDAICRDLRQKQARSGRKVVSFPPKRPDRILMEVPTDLVAEVRELIARHEAA
ncbi:MAG: hypothetical protein KJO08_04575 [Gammaproteobacteria bacterium]|nr:hypothetical protein [Gammaproteobacteria bacterium]NNJ85388.1 hypothetical protein [Gammaproteobacteria bacterium]